MEAQNNNANAVWH